MHMEQEVPIIVSSDAHDPSWVGEWKDALKLIEECGFDEDLILNNNAEKVLRFINS